MRHSRRADKDGEPWHQMDVRTWDPPLSTVGHSLAIAQAFKISEIISDVQMIISSPYLRCLQTAHHIRIAVKVQPESLSVDLALSELYDYWNSIRYVNSPDITKDGQYQNMSRWFYRFKRRHDKEAKTQANRLCDQETSIQEQLEKYVSKDYGGIEIVGSFPSFERYLTLPIINQRYCKCFEESVARCEGNLIIVTHMSGVTSIIYKLFGRVKYYIKPCDYFVLERHRRSSDEDWGRWKLLYY